MMLTIDVCLVINCFLFEKFYLHYALSDFDSILLHCNKLFIRQSIDREQIFDVTFQNPPHWKILRTPLLQAKAKDTQKKSEAKAKDNPSEDRLSRGQRQKCLRPRPRTKDKGASVFKKKIFFRRSQKIRSSKIFLPVLELGSRGFYV